MFGRKVGGAFGPARCKRRNAMSGLSRDLATPRFFRLPEEKLLPSSCAEEQSNAQEGYRLSLSILGSRWPACRRSSGGRRKSCRLWVSSGGELRSKCPEGERKPGRGATGELTIAGRGKRVRKAGKSLNDMPEVFEPGWHYALFGNSVRWRNPMRVTVSSGLVLRRVFGVVVARTHDRLRC